MLDLKVNVFLNVTCIFLILIAWSLIYLFNN